MTVGKTLWEQWAVKMARDVERSGVRKWSVAGAVWRPTTAVFERALNEWARRWPAKRWRKVRPRRER